MINVTVKHLKYFVALASHGHFGRAADTCGISQPALSVQMKDLEEILGAPLIDRSAKQIRLTALGEDFAERARAILQSVEDLGDLARASHSPLVGRLRLGVIPTVAPYLLPRVIRHLVAQYSGLELRPREALTQRLIEDLLERRLDAALVALPISEPSLHEEALFDEEFVLVRPLSDADKPVPNPARLREMKLLLLQEGHCFRDQALSFCDMSAALPRDQMEGSSLSTLVQMVGAGIGVTLIPEMAVPIDTKTAPVSVARLPAPRPSRRVGMVWRKSNPMSAQLAHIADELRKSGMLEPHS